VPYIIRPRHVHRSAAGLFAALLLTVATPAMASAACPKTVTTQAFAAFGDNASYTLLEGGLFESGAPGWSLSNAEVSGDNPEEQNHSYDRFGDGSRYSRGGRTHSLVIDRNGEAVSPPFCVSAEFPSFRFLARQYHGYGGLDVSLRWTDSRGRSHETADATIQGSESWAITPVLELASKLPAGTTPNVRLVFQPNDSDWAIADVYIDPYRR
jgi:hypothetical protein